MRLYQETEKLGIKREYENEDRSRHRRSLPGQTITENDLEINKIQRYIMKSTPGGSRAMRTEWESTGTTSRMRTKDSIQDAGRRNRWSIFSSNVVPPVGHKCGI